MKPIVKEEFVVVLDFLPNGYPFDKRPLHLRTAIAQAMGKNHFILLELVPKKGVFLQPGKEVYIGEGKRDEIHHIIEKIPSEKLTQTAKFELENSIEKIVISNEAKFVDFFNKAQPINIREHQLELLPGLGKKHMWQVLEERDKKLFESFSDIKKRVKLMPDPMKAIIKRIIHEIEGKEKYHLFVDV